MTPLSTIMWPLQRIDRHIQQFLNASDARELIGADPAVANFELLNLELNAAFFKNLDHLPTVVGHVAALLERGVRVLIYAGSYDWSQTGWQTSGGRSIWSGVGRRSSTLTENSQARHGVVRV